MSVHQVDLPVEDVLCQGFGGGAQAVESGASGSEPSSCTSSPVSSPCTSSPYVSAPSSPGKSVDRKMPSEISTVPSSFDRMELDSEHQDSTEAQIDKTVEQLDDNKNLTKLTMEVNVTEGKKMEGVCSAEESQYVAKSTTSEQSTKPRRKSARQDGTPATTRSSRSERVMQAAISSISMVKKPTALISNEVFCAADHSETCKDYGCISSIMERCSNLLVLDECLKLQPRPANEEEILAAHTQDILQSIPKRTREDTFTAAGSTIELVQAIVSGRAQNGMAVVRPSGHLVADCNAPPSSNLNNIAIGARYALENLKLNRIMIINLDSEHGTETQRIFYDDPRVVMFSISVHNAQDFNESNCDRIGELKGLGSNVNVRLNRHYFNCEDYYSVFHQLLLPVAYEFAPQLILVSAGYELSLHSPSIHPVMYSHLTSLLMSLAEGRLAMVLEVGQYKDAIAEGVAATLLALQDKPSEIVLAPANDLSLEVRQSVADIIRIQQANWSSLRYHAQTSALLCKANKSTVASSPPQLFQGQDHSKQLLKLGKGVIFFLRY